MKGTRDPPAPTQTRPHQQLWKLRSDIQRRGLYLLSWVCEGTMGMMGMVSDFLSLCPPGERDGESW